jgi:hypothetical protein
MRSRKHTFYELEVEVEDRCFVCNVDYTYYPGDPGVRYYPDGSGCPPTPPEVDITAVTVVAIYLVDGEKVKRSWLVERGWAAWADQAGFDALSMDNDDNYYHTLCSDAEYDDYA